MKILVVGDCHGVKPDLGDQAEKADLVLVTGDVCGDSDKVREAMFKAMDSEKMWYDVFGRKKAEKAVEKSLEKGREVFEYLNSLGKPVFVVPGNWDWTGEESWSFLSENRFQNLIDEFKNIHNIDREVFDDTDFSYIGYGPCSAPELPQYEDDKPETEEEMKAMREEYRETRQNLKELFRDAENPVIFLSHNVPHSTSLDQIENPDSPADGRHYGSLIVKELIEEFNPLLSVAGHIHEGYGVEEVSKTRAVNAGLNSYVFLELDEDSVNDLEFYPGIS